MSVFWLLVSFWWCMGVNNPTVITVSMDTQSNLNKQSSALAIVDKNVGNDNEEEVTVSEEEVIQNINEFTPTNEWKTIEEGQVIPAGLHVRIDLQTGKKEAKLIDKNNDEPLETTSGPASMSFSPEELKMALKNMKLSHDDVKHGDVHRTMSHSEKAAGTAFRSYAELKRTLGEMSMREESDATVMARLLAEYGASHDTEKRRNILADLEYYVHQIDNAQDFVKMGGLAVVREALNSSHSELRAEAAHVLGSSLQSNPKVQVAVLEAAMLQPLIHRLNEIPADLTERRRMLYAISCLVRHFPLAQEKFVSYGGIQVLVGLFENSGVHKLQVKAVDLVSDLLVERHGILEDTVPLNNELLQQRLQQYNSVNLEKVLRDQLWCNRVVKLLITDEHDTRERVLQALKLLSHDVCIPTSDQDLLEFLQTMQSEYTRLVQVDGADDSYFLHLHQLASDVLEVLRRSAVKDEL